MLPAEMLQLLQLLTVLLGRLTAFKTRQTIEGRMLKTLVDRICHETGPFIENSRVSVSESAEDPLYEDVQICYTVKRRKLGPSRMNEFVTSSMTTDTGYGYNLTDGAEVGEPAMETADDWDHYDPHARNTSLWITLVIAAMSIAIVAVIILGPRYTKKCILAIRRRTGNGRRQEDMGRRPIDDNMRYLYGEWDPSTESERTTPSGVTVNTVGLVMSTYVTGAAVGSTYDNATCDGGYSYLYDDDNDCSKEPPSESDRTSESKPDTGGDHVTTAVTEISMPEDDYGSESEQTGESEDCDESGSAENVADADDASQTEDQKSNCVSDELTGAANDGFVNLNRLERRTGNSSVDVCVCSMSDDLDTDWSYRAESSQGDSVGSSCEENIMLP